MKQVLVHNLVPGMIVGKDVYAQNNMLLTPAGTKLTNKTIASYLLHSIISIFIQEEVHTEPNNEPSSVPQKRVPFTQTRQFITFTKNFMNTTASLEDQINSVVTRNVPFNPAVLLSQTSELFTDDMNTFGLFDMLHHMRHYDDSTYIHSVNVALICNVFGQWLNYSKTDIDVLTLCGLLHDIGKVEIPDSIIKKPGKLTPEEYNIIKRHPYKGYQILKKHPELDERIAQAALLHHERCDGSGYPMGCKRNHITDFAMIVSIADVYDAMTSERVYRGALSPFKVLRALQEDGIEKYDPQFFLPFMERIVNTYINTDVLLNDGTKAHVIYINKDDLSHPIVQAENKIIDLSKMKGLEIETLL